MMVNKWTPHRFICQMPMTETNWRVIIIPNIIGTKSPKCLIDGVKSMGKDNNTKTIARTLQTVIIFGLSALFISLITSDGFYRIHLRSAICRNKPTNHTN